MFSIQVQADVDVLSKWADLPLRFREALAAKMDVLALALEEKVRENLSGKVLNVKSGQLLGSIHREVYTTGGEFIAFVGPVPASAKAWTQEYGGKAAFLIRVGTKGVLANIETGFFSKHDVMHPALRERSYLRSALLELTPMIEEGLAATIHEAIR